MKVIIVMLVFDWDDRRWSETCDHSWQPRSTADAAWLHVYVIPVIFNHYSPFLNPHITAPRTTQSRGNARNQGNNNGFRRCLCLLLCSTKHASLLYNRLHRRINSCMAKTRAAVIIYSNIGQHLPIKFALSIVSLFSVSCVFTVDVLKTEGSILIFII